MGENARSQTLGVIGNNVVKRACDKRGRPIGARMTKGERNSHDSEREPVKFAKWNSLEMFVDNKAKQETAPENFFHQRNDDNKTEETKKNRRPISSRVVLKQCRVEANGTRREVKEILRPDPDAKNGHRDEQAKDDVFQSMKLVAATKLEQERATEDSLHRINPELGMTQEKYLAASGEELAKREQSQEQNHWQDVGQELPAMRLHFGFRNGIVIFPRCLRKRTPARRRWRARSNWSWRRSDCTGNAAAKNIERCAF